MVKDKVEILRLYENPRTIGCGEYQELHRRVQQELIDTQFYLLVTKNQWFLDSVIMELDRMHWRSIFKSYSSLDSLYGSQLPDIKVERSIDLATAIQSMQRAKFSDTFIRHNEYTIRRGILLYKEEDRKL
jgi:hypothetical protein